MRSCPEGHRLRAESTHQRWSCQLSLADRPYSGGAIETVGGYLAIGSVLMNQPR